MDDLIIRLREEAETEDSYGIEQDFYHAKILREAADEIECLRKINANLMGDDENVPRYTMRRMKQEVERRVNEAIAEYTKK